MDMTELFAYRMGFNDSLSDWDVSNVVSMKDMFHYAKAFNQPLDGWDVRKVKDMTGMFMKASSFNQPVDTWQWCADSLEKDNDMFSDSGCKDIVPLTVRSKRTREVNESTL